MPTEIVIALISAGLPTLATAVTAIIQSRENNKHAAKQSIFQMILEDHVAVGEGKLPTNYQNVLHEFDIYHKNGGNSFVERKVKDYLEWFDTIQTWKNGETSKGTRESTRSVRVGASKGSNIGKTSTLNGNQNILNTANSQKKY